MGKTEVEPGMPLNEIVKNLRQKYDDALLLTQHQRYANAIYLSPRSAKETDATSMLSATQTLVKALCEISL